jgi:hypothetical protein
MLSICEPHGAAAGGLAGARLGLSSACLLALSSLAFSEQSVFECGPVPSPPRASANPPRASANPPRASATPPGAFAFFSACSLGLASARSAPRRRTGPYLHELLLHGGVAVGLQLHRRVREPRELRLEQPVRVLRVRRALHQPALGRVHACLRVGGRAGGLFLCVCVFVCVCVRVFVCVCWCVVVCVRARVCVVRACVHAHTRVCAFMPVRDCECKRVRATKCAKVSQRAAKCANVRHRWFSSSDSFIFSSARCSCACRANRPTPCGGGQGYSAVPAASVCRYSYTFR